MSGGQMMYVRDDLPQRRPDDLEGYVCDSYDVSEIFEDANDS